MIELLELGLVEDLTLCIRMQKCFLFLLLLRRKIRRTLPCLSGLPFAHFLQLLAVNCIDTFQFNFEIIHLLLFFCHFRVRLSKLSRNLLELSVFLCQFVLEGSIMLSELSQLGVEEGERLMVGVGMVE